MENPTRRTVPEEAHSAHQVESCPEIDELCEHLRRIGLDATVESKKSKRRGFAIFRLHSLIFGSVRVMNQNIDLVELERIGGNEVYLWQCNYVVQAKVNGLEDRLKAKLKVVRKGFWMPKVVDFKWEGRELAQVLNGDVDLRDKLYRMARAIYHMVLGG